MQDYAEGRRAAASALATTMYWLSTRPLGYAQSGFVDEAVLMLDGRRYEVESGGWASIVDDRGLFSLNVPDRDTMLPALTSLGASFDQASRMIAVLEDYVDPDSLRRVNGAERDDYRELGLTPPRNQWLLTTDELARMPVWRDMRELRERFQPFAGLRREKVLNPNTAPLDVLRLAWPRVAESQWLLFDDMRRRMPFANADAARAATGIPFDDEHTLFHASGSLRVTVGAPGMPQALEYNLWLVPDGERAPWLIHAVGMRSTPTAPAANKGHPSPSVLEHFPNPTPNLIRPSEPAPEAP
ncbi:hypothetical protein [Roseateles sp.]|uniref:hypothetical protein n=1 Tax=Roseateles sp. TaxID=1971397 RepID=UPI003BAA4C56